MKEQETCTAQSAKLQYANIECSQRQMFSAMEFMVTHWPLEMSLGHNAILVYRIESNASCRDRVNPM